MLSLELTMGPTSFTWVCCNVQVFSGFRALIAWTGPEQLADEDGFDHSTSGKRTGNLNESSRKGIIGKLWNPSAGLS